MANTKWSPPAPTPENIRAALDGKLDVRDFSAEDIADARSAAFSEGRALLEATVSGVAEAGTLTAAATDIDSVEVVATKFGSIESYSSEWEDDASPEALSMLVSAIKTGIASDETTLLEPDPQQGPRTLLGFPVAFSSQITLTEGTAGSWAALLDTSQLMVCERRPARLEVSRDYRFSEDLVSIKATWRGALAALNPEAISLLTDVRA